MSLKVLLADDSAAIKKVVQLSLQDFGVELKSVNSGKDVLDVAKTFKPDIAFVDVLLPHKTGYEIANAIKKDNQLQSIPVIMLWSSFMDFDEKKFKDSGAEDKLEKPFEVSGLRSLITKYVPKTLSNPLLKHLEFPKLNFDFAEQAPKVAAPAPVSIPEPEPELEFVAPTPPPPQPTDDNMWSGDSEWVRKDLGKFHMPIPEEGAEENTVSFRYNDTNIKETDFLLKPEDLEAKTPEPLAPQPTPTLNFGSAEGMTPELQEHAKKVIEQVVWKIVPEIAANIIREEIQKLLNEEK